jgi:hypothetical protein
VRDYLLYLSDCTVAKPQHDLSRGTSSTRALSLAIRTGGEREIERGADVAAKS